MPEDNKDYIFNRLDNERKQINEQKRRINERKVESQKNWVSKAIDEVGEFLGKLITLPFKILSDLFTWIFGR